MNKKPQDGIARPLDKIVMCPVCEAAYTKILYDWQYIHCNDCGTYFVKHTGKLINHKGTPQELPKHFWKTDGEIVHITLDLSGGALSRPL